MEKDRLGEIYGREMGCDEIWRCKNFWLQAELGSVRANQTRWQHSRHSGGQFTHFIRFTLTKICAFTTRLEFFNAFLMARLRVGKITTQKEGTTGSNLICDESFINEITNRTKLWQVINLCKNRPWRRDWIAWMIGFRLTNISAFLVSFSFSRLANLVVIIFAAFWSEFSSEIFRETSIRVKIRKFCGISRKLFFMVTN